MFQVDVPEPQDLPGENNVGAAEADQDAAPPAKKPRAKRAKKRKALDFDDVRSEKVPI